MPPKTIFALAAIVTLPACGLGGPRLDPLTGQDQASFTGSTCTVVRDGAVLYITDGESGLIRYRGTPVRLQRLAGNLPFDPRDLDSLKMMSSGDSLELSFRGVVQPPGTVNETPQGYTRHVMITIEDRSMGGARRLNQGADLHCGPLPPAADDAAIMDVNKLFGNDL